jgi:O-antigen ligase
MVMHPFYNDHTAYGAVIAMFIPVVFSFALKKNWPKPMRILAISVAVMLVAGIIFSYSRAAWLSLSFSLVLYIVVMLKIKFRYVLSGIILLAGLFYLFQFQLIDRLEKNKQDSSTDFLEHIQSISNISSDASNLERINRWNCAIRLFNERPFFGWGPGTYQFVYAPFQRSKEKTIISTNAGDMGNAHSEYIGPLSESGVLGMITFIIIVITVMVTGLRVYKRARSPEVKWLSLATILGLFSYFIHGLLNNFLDTDKASVPFWGFIAILVALDIYHKEKGNFEIEKEQRPEGS